MIYFLTVHYHSKKWVDVQSRFLRKCVKAPYKVFACLNGRAIAESHRFYYAEDICGSHASKLNYLADKAIVEADDQDLLVFIDGDAFPIHEGVLSYIMDKVRVDQLIAVRRDENLGDVQPHPSFCATTVGLWKAIKGDWMPGAKWINSRNDTITSVGGNLLRILQDNEITWHPMKRSNKRNLHPLWFGVYDDMIYHHGAGFRDPVSRVDLAACPFVLMKRFRSDKIDLPNWFRPATRSIGRWFVNMWCIRNYMLSKKIYNKICVDEEFYKIFT